MGAYFPSISADGRFVAFESPCNSLVPGDNNGTWDVFVRDRKEGTTEYVSVSTAGVQGNVESHNPSISADGRFVAFSSDASNLVPGDNNGEGDIFVRDRKEGTTERVSVSTAGVGNGTDALSSYSFSSISADGRFVAFSSSATNLVPGDDNNGVMDIFVRGPLDDPANITTSIVSIANTVQGN